MVRFIYTRTGPIGTRNVADSTHKRRCIGKLDNDGNPVYNKYYLTRQKMEDLERQVAQIDAVSTTTLVGQRKVLEAEVRKTGVRKALAAARGWKGGIQAV